MRKFLNIAVAAIAAITLGIAPAMACSCSKPVKKTAHATAKVPSVRACAANDKYYRATNAFFLKYGLMAVCDANSGGNRGGQPVGAVNIKKYDGDVTSIKRPSEGPLMAGGCVVTDIRYVHKFSYSGCRAGVLKVFDLGGHATFEVVFYKGHIKKGGGTFTFTGGNNLRQVD